MAELSCGSPCGSSSRKNPRISRFLLDAQLFQSHAAENNVLHCVMEETNLQFELCLDGKDPIPCSIIASEVDYPDGTVVIIGNGGPEFVNLSVDKAFEKIAKDLRKTADKISLDSGLEMQDTDSRPASRNSEFLSDANDEYEDVIDHLASIEIMQAHAELGALFSKFCPSGLDHADLYFEMPYTDVFSGVCMKAWGFPEHNSLKITLENVYLVGYRSGNENPLVKVELSVLKEDEKSPGIVEQIRMIARTYISNNFKLERRIIEDDFIPKANFLVGFYDYIRGRLSTLNEYCIICDAKLDISLLMPCVCYRPLCTFGYTDLGIMADVGIFATDPAVIDLLLAMLHHAVRGFKLLPFDLFPSIADPEDTNKLALDPQNPDNQLLTAVLAALPQGEKLFEILGNHAALRGHHRLAWPVIRWTLTSNRAYIVPLALDVQLPFMCTAYQFLMLTDSPAKEKAFRDAKKKSPKHVHYVFHGSPAFNWHSILRRGLLIGSQGVPQLNGAAFGKGIYLSPLSAVSARYSDIYGGQAAFMQMHKQRKQGSSSIQQGLVERPAAEGSKHLFDQVHNMTCIAICEVIGDNLQKHDRDIWTLTEPEHCCTRFLFAYAGNNQLNTNIDLRGAENMELLNKALQRYNLA